jgi:alpha-1,2-mannosyltransferase
VLPTMDDRSRPRDRPLIKTVAVARRRAPEFVVAAGIFVLGFSARLITALRGSGLDGIMYYDDGVNFAAAIGLVHGWLPYRDFLLLHPPGIVVALTPFAGLAALTSDAAGLVIARVVFMIIGGINAVLVAAFLRPTGRLAALSGGLLYAVFWPAVYSERTVLLEGLANTCLLGSLILISPAAGRPTKTRLFLGGLLLGVSAAIKIWGVVPVLILFGWLLVRLGFRRASLLVLGAMSSCAAICLPFFVAAPSVMWRMVVRDQLLRIPNDTSWIQRVTEILGLGHLPARITLPLVIAMVVLVVGMVLAWQVARARPAVLLLLALGAMLLMTPTWFIHYSALTAPMIAITAGAAAHQALRLAPVRRRRWLRIGMAAAVLVAPLVAALPIALVRVGERFPGQPLAVALAPSAGCITSDHPSALILTDVLSRNLERGCQLVADLGGASHDMAASGGDRGPRVGNVAFQQYLLAYLSSGERTLVARFGRDAGLSDTTADTIEAWPVVAQYERFTVRAPQP